MSFREKYLNTLLQVEMMLKLWFPQIITQSVSTTSSVTTSAACSLQDTSSSTPPHKHRDQLHIPVKVRTHAFLCACKRLLVHTQTAIEGVYIHLQITLLFIFQKRRLSWTGSDSPTPSPALLKCPRITSEQKKVKPDLPPTLLASEANQNSPDVAANSQPSEYTKGQVSGSEELGKLSKYKAGQSSEPSLTWVHIAPILSPRKACTSHESTTVAGNNKNQSVTTVLPPGRRGSPATQDSSVSSTTPHKHPKNLKKPIRCQSQRAAGQESDSETINAHQGQSQSPHVTLKPLPRACPTPLETWCIVKQRAGSLSLLHRRAESCRERKKGRGWRPVIIEH